MTGKIKLNATSGGGSVSFQAPSSTGDDRIITLPTTADGTLLTTTNPKSGSIIQVVSTILTSAASFNVGNGATDNITGLSASITPSSSSNKILIMYSISYDISNISAKGGFRIKRGSTVIGNGDSAGNRYLVNCGYSSNNNEDQALMSCSNNFVDSPSTTSATTYQMCMHGGGTTQDIFINRARSDGNESDDPRAASSLILMEVSV